MIRCWFSVSISENRGCYNLGRVNVILRVSKILKLINLNSSSSTIDSDRFCLEKGIVAKRFSDRAKIRVGGRSKMSVCIFIIEITVVWKYL